MAAQLAETASGRARLLRRLRTMCLGRCRLGADSRSALETHHPERTGPCGTDAAVGNHLPSTLVERQVLGERFATKRRNNVVNWIIVILLFVMSLLLAAQVAVPQLFPNS
jgi:hypothetical protein